MANIFSGAVKFLGETLRQVATPDTLKDYAHANRLFVGSNFRLVPKTGFLFHVFFDVNSAIQSAFRTTENQIEMGLMVKNIDLPKFTVDTKVFNSYNRPNLIQSKVRFDSVSMTFHDDSANLVRNFWYDYFRYHYRDSDYTIQRYDMAYKYANEMDMNFGYGPNKDEKPGTVDNYLRAIRIYSLHQKRFSEYILINPIIKSFKHGTHSQGASDLLEHNMIVEYENVLYQEGAVASDGIINLLDQAGLEKPQINIFSEDFMNDIRNMKQKNVAIELLKKLLADQIKLRFKRNAVIDRSFSERLQDAIARYNNKSITALQMIEVLLEITQDVNTETARGNDLGLTETEKAFYDALTCNKSALDLMGDAKLVEIAKELVRRVKNSTTIDWTVRQSAKDRVRLEVKRVLRFHKYPPDDQPRAVNTVIEQAEMHAEELV